MNTLGIIGSVVVFTGFAVFGGCGGSQATSACVPGQPMACAGTTGCTGTQVCRSDGSGYDACVCTNQCAPGQSIACAGAAGCSGSQTCKSDGSGYDVCACAGDAGTCLLPSEVAARWVAFDWDPGTFNRDIYFAHGDGSQVKRITSETSTDIEPAFSHDGKWLSFASDRSGTMQIHLMDLVQGSVTQLTTLAAGADQPSWSADDSKIVFHSGPSVYMMDANGSNPVVVGTGLDNFNAYEYPSLSLDGTQVVFDRRNEIDARNLDQSGQRYVVQNATTTEETPAVSPDGLAVAYAVYCGSVEQISVTPFAGYAADPCTPMRVTPASAGACRRPAWGGPQLLAFERSASSDSSLNPSVIAVSTSPGSAPCNITTNGDSHNPSWAPAGFQPK
ncbi:MAG TPA: hypothetical protein VLM85_24455 [Polyangiaceae bacterium]|nr:hypothetical protein [Polyangiaceae bacterium]